MTGRVLGQQALLGVTFCVPDQPDFQIEYVVDTGFAGALTLPEAAVEALGLPFVQFTGANLADDSFFEVAAHRATLRWHGRLVEVAVLAMGERPLLGTALLDECDVTIRFRDGGSVSVLPIQD